MIRIILYMYLLVQQKGYNDYEYLAHVLIGVTKRYND